MVAEGVASQNSYFYLKRTNKVLATYLPTYSLYYPFLVVAY